MLTDMRVQFIFLTVVVSIVHVVSVRPPNLQAARRDVTFTPGPPSRLRTAAALLADAQSTPESSLAPAAVVPAAAGQAMENLTPSTDVAKMQLRSGVPVQADPHSLHMCPAVPEDSMGLCVEECFSDYECAGAGMLCCPNGCGHTCQKSVVKEPSRENVTYGGTACECICGERAIWRHEIFPGDVVEEKERECEFQVCPNANIPGLIVHAECHHVKDMAELTAGTLCNCQCGDKAVWQSRAFYGNVVEEKEHLCLHEVCPKANPIPGFRFEAKCIFDKDLFAVEAGYLRQPNPTFKPVEERGAAAPTLAQQGIMAALVAIINLSFNFRILPRTAT